jgi:hypothetical protein
VPIDIVEGLLFQSFKAYTRKNYKFSLLTVAQALEIFINQYLINSPNFIIEETGTSYKFRKRKERVSTIQKYSDVLKDYKGVSLASYNSNLWDKLDIIVILRNSIIHRNESRYLESGRHHKLRNVKDYKLDIIINISSEYPNLYQSAIQIIDWVKHLP